MRQKSSHLMPDRLGLHRYMALVIGAAQAIDQEAPEISAECIATGGSTFRRAPRFGPVRREPQYLEKNELSDEFILVVAQASEFRRVVGMKRALHRVIERRRLLLRKLQPAAPQVDEFGAVGFIVETLDRQGHHLDLQEMARQPRREVRDACQGAAQHGDRPGGV